MKELIPDDELRRKIFTIREVQVMLDRDLAELYEIPTKQLNLAVKRNRSRFPEDFMFKLDKSDINKENILRFQFETSSSSHGGIRYFPNVFTEQGVAMLSGILNSKKAIDVNIKIMRAFISIRKFILKNTEIIARLDKIEREEILFQIKTTENFEKVFDAMQSRLPEAGIFFDDQVFDAYVFVSDLIKTAKKKIILIDNYIDESTLNIFSKTNVKTIIYTKEITKQLELDMKKYNEQYDNIELKILKESHDRFIIIDNDTYHIGASLKDLGKKWFAFSKIDITKKGATSVFCVAHKIILLA